MFSRLLQFALVVVVAGVVPARVTWAQIGSDQYSAFVMDASTGTVLTQDNADTARFPASLTKLMTIYLVFEAIRDHRLTLTEPVPVSAQAAAKEPTKLGLLPGTYITVEQAVLGLVTKSANDAAAALGEMLGGDEDRFAQVMTQRARALGMTRTTFRNASGLPDNEQVTTARDMATLAKHLIDDFPMYYWYFSVPSFRFQGRTVLNHQRMLQTYPGADGLKTGYIVSSGYNVVTSAVHGNVRLIGVVMGAFSGGERDQHMASLLDQGFGRSGAPVMARAVAPNRMAALIAAAQAQQGLPIMAPYGQAVQPSYPVLAGRPREYAAAPAIRRSAKGATTRVHQAALPMPPAQPRLPTVHYGHRTPANLPPGYGY